MCIYVLLESRLELTMPREGARYPKFLLILPLREKTVILRWRNTAPQWPVTKYSAVHPSLKRERLPTRYHPGAVNPSEKMGYRVGL